jgi:hypothetical protein
VAFGIIFIGIREFLFPAIGALGAGALGLLVGIGVPLVGAAAALGPICFFVAALITHLCAGDYSFGLAVIFLVLAVAVLALRVDTSRDVASALLFRLSATVYTARLNRFMVRGRCGREREGIGGNRKESDDRW